MTPPPAIGTPQYRHWLGQAIRLIPTHREGARTLDELAHELARQTGLAAAEAHGAMAAAIAVLDLFGALSVHEDRYRLVNQVAAYFVNSLQWFIETDTHILGGWPERGALHPSSMRESSLESAPRFLRLIEERRVKLAERLGIEPRPSRDQAAVFLFIEKEVAGVPHYLHQYDEPAGQYQLIGGRVETGESPERAAVREFTEEVAARQKPPWREDVDFTLEPLLPHDQPIQLTSISPTYGALTAYQFYPFFVHLRVRNLALGANDRWFSASELLSGRAASGERLSDPRVFVELNRRMNGALRANRLRVAVDSIQIEEDEDDQSDER